MEYRGYRSPNYVVTSGVPQGSNLGPLLFLMYINDISEEIGVEFCLFADDLKVYKPIKSVEDCCQMQQTLNNLHRWCEQNKLRFNISKCFAMTISLKKSLLTYNYSIDGIALQRAHRFRDLGVTFNSQYNFNDHIRDVYASANKTMGFVMRNCREFTDIHSLKILFYALISSKLEYACLIWSPYYQVHVNCLERLQRRFMKFLAFKCDGVYPPQGFSNAILLKRFNMLSPLGRRELVIYLYLCIFLGELSAGL